METPAESACKTDVCERWHSSKIELKSYHTMDIFTASNRGDYHLVEQLVRNTDVNRTNGSRWTPLMYATHSYQEKTVGVLLSHGATLHHCDVRGLNVIMMSARYGYGSLLQLFKQHCQFQELLDAKDSMGWTALFHAICFRHLEVVKSLVTFGANPNAFVDSSRLTPLMVAASTGDVPLVDLLLHAGAHPGLVNSFGHNARTLASMARHDQVVALLDRSSPIQDLVPVPSDLDTLLSHIGLESYITLFRDLKVDLSFFLRLSQDDLLQYGVKNEDSRRKMVEAIERWRDKVPCNLHPQRLHAQKLEIKLKLLELEMQRLRTNYEKASSVGLKMGLSLGQLHRLCRLLGHNLASAFREASLVGAPLLIQYLNRSSYILDDIFSTLRPWAQSNLPEGK